MDTTVDSGPGPMFTIIPVLIGIGFVVVLGAIAYRMITGTLQWNRNNNSPVVTRSMRVVTKRTQVDHTSGTAMNSDTPGMRTSGTTSTTYFVTFEDPSTRQREEFRVTGREYGQLAEGDTGTLTSQGTRYQGFVRA